MKGSLFQIITFSRPTPSPGRKGGTAVAVRKGILYNHADLPPLVTVEATGVFMPIDNSEMPNIYFGIVQFKTSNTILPSTMQLLYLSFSFSLSQHVSAVYGHHQVFFCQKLFHCVLHPTSLSHMNAIYPNLK
jgi:hypothetical protein